MPLTAEGFLKRLKAGKAVNCNYRKGSVIGLIGSWRHEGKYDLTWEECNDSDFHNDAAYLRDEVHNFATAEEVLTFVTEKGYPPAEFNP